MSFFSHKGDKVKPQFTGLSAQTSVSSLPITYAAGKNRIAPNIIWQGDFQSHKQYQKVGKGGGKVESYTYSASFLAGLCWGEITAITRTWKDQSTETDYTKLGFSLFLGTNPQAPWGYLVTAHPTEALGYPDIAYLAVASYDLGQSNTFPQHSFEAETLLYNTGVGGTVPDADPAQLVIDFLADPVHGVGFNTGIIDQDSLYSGPDAPTTGDNAFQTYCRAMGFALSPVLSSQSAAGDIIERWTEICNTALVWTGYSLKFFPYGSETVTANGVTYLPNFPVRYNLTDKDYIYSEGEEPIIFRRVDPADAYNSLSMIIANKNNEYNDLPVSWRDQGLIDQFTLRSDQNYDAKEVTDPAMAAIMVTLMGQRKAYIRNTFEFKLSSRYCRLEPMDILQCYIPRLGYQYVLVTEVEEADDGTIGIVAQEYPESITSPASSDHQSVSNNPINTAVAAGPVNPPVIFEPNSVLAQALRGSTTPCIVAAISGGDGTTYDANWGGCNVWLSTDDITYNSIGVQNTAARQGKLTASLATYGGVNPDTGHTLKVTLLMSNGDLSDAASSADAEAGVTRSYVDGEIISYETTNLTGTNAYDLTNLWRGQDGSTIGAHSSGTQYARLDNNLFFYDLPPSYIGVPLYVKLQSFNIFGGGLQDLADCVAYTITPDGVGFGGGTGGVPTTPAAPTVVSGNAQNALSWAAAPLTDNVTSYEVWRAAGTGAAFGSASLLATTAALAYTDSSLPPSTGYTYFLKSVNAVGPSTHSTGANGTTSAASFGGGSLVGTAATALTAGNLVHVYDNSGTLTVEKADATDLTKPANGFILASYAGGATTVVVYMSGQFNTGITGLSPGATYWLDYATPGGVSATPPPDSVGHGSQIVGIANAAGNLYFSPQPMNGI